MYNQEDSNDSQIPNNIKTYHAWTFSEILPGTFKRNKAVFAHLDYPIIAPLPTLKAKTQPIELSNFGGPFIYFVLDRNGCICYIGKTEEATVIKRWVRPDTENNYFWTHSTKVGGTVFNIADGLNRGDGPFTLRYSTLVELLPVIGKQCGIKLDFTEKQALKLIEDGLVKTLTPKWNKR